jgi:hypothetical protein
MKIGLDHEAVVEAAEKIFPIKRLGERVVYVGMIVADDNAVRVRAQHRLDDDRPRSVQRSPQVCLVWRTDRCLIGNVQAVCSNRLDHVELIAPGADGLDAIRRQP